MIEIKKGHKIRKWNENYGDVENDNDDCFMEETFGAGPSVSRDFMRGIEDMVEQNDNNFDGVINNLPEEKPVAQMNAADVIEEEQEKKSILKKLQEAINDAPKPKPVEPCCICNAMERF